MKKIQRLHDKLYLKENRYKKTKDIFKYINRILNKNIIKNKKYDVLDIRCAAGELLYYLERKYKNFNLTGYDIRNDLLKKAASHLTKETNLKQVNINKKNKFLKKKFDIIICTGVIGIFDDLENFKINILKLLKKNGIILIGGLINEFNFNVFVKYEDLKNKNILQSGWNIWSINTIKKLFNKKKVKIYKYNPSKKFKKIKNDPVRSWTINVDGKRYFTNAIIPIQNFLVVKIY